MFAWAPHARHSAHLFQQQLIAEGNPSTISVRVQQFDHPGHTQPMALQYPTWDAFWVEAPKRDTLQPFVPPDWVKHRLRLGMPADAAASAADAEAQAHMPAVPAVPAMMYDFYNDAIAALASAPVMLVYRHDVLRKHSLPVPETWQQLLQIAAYVNGTDFNGDGVRDHALCVDIDPSCKSYWLFASIAASILQVNGTSSGFIVDPAKGEPLVNTPAMTTALRLWRQLLVYNSPLQSSKPYCGLWEDAFLAGSCAFTLGSTQMHGITNTTYASGRTGLAPSPGSLEVWDRRSGLLVPCDATRCPYCTPLQTPLLLTPRSQLWTRVGRGAPAASGCINRAPVMSSSRTKQQTRRGSKQLSDRLDAFARIMEFKTSDYAILGLIGVYFARTPQAQANIQMPGLDLSTTNVTYFSHPDFILDMYRWIEQLRNQTRWPVDPYAVEPVVDPALYYGGGDYFGYNRAEVAAYLRLLVWSLLHPNMALDPQNMGFLRALTAKAASQAQQGLNETLIAADIAYKLGPSMWGSVPTAWWDLNNYRSDLAYKDSLQVVASTQSPPDRGQPLAPGQLAAVIVVPIVVTVLAVLAAVLWMHRFTARRYNMLGKVRAPGVSPSTTLVVTDIQDSTLLWERLPHSVMDAALHTHNSTLRGLLPQHCGYETCTEGDSFLIAFHCAVDAARYCLAAQQALMCAPWPEQLLSDSEAAAQAAEVFVSLSNDALKWAGVSIEQPVCASGNTRKGLLPGLTYPRLVRRTSPRRDAISVTGSFADIAALDGRSAPSPRQPTPTSTTGRVSVQLSVQPDSLFDSEDHIDVTSGQSNVEAVDQLVAVALPLSAWLAQQARVESASSVPPAWQQPPQQAVLHRVPAFRGLRVRMGVHSGLTDPADWNCSTTTGRWHASGAFLAAAKAVCDVGVGGMILVSGSAWNELCAGRQGTHAVGDAVTAHMGAHHMEGQAEVAPLYLMMPTALTCRLAVFAPLRSLGLSSPGILSAPVKTATIVFMHAVGVKSLQAWDAELARSALRIYHQAVSRALLGWQGYLVELTDGLCLAAFTDPGHAIGWALSCQADLLTQAWDPRLLEHELCEEVAMTMIVNPHDQLMSMQPVSPRQPGTPTVLHATLPTQHHGTQHHTGQSFAHIPRPQQPPLKVTMLASAATTPGGTPTHRHSTGKGSGHSALCRSSLLSHMVDSRSACCEGAASAEHDASVSAAVARSGSVVSAGSHGSSQPLGVAVARPVSRHMSQTTITLQPINVQRKVVLRGLRIKAGIEMGRVSAGLCTATGRMEYRGKAMNRASRISGHATSSQVLCSEVVWQAGKSSQTLQQLPIIGTSLGSVSLKGMTGAVQLVSCSMDTSVRCNNSNAVQDMVEMQDLH